MQIRIPQPEAVAPLGASDYVAALQNKPGELDALQHVSPAAWQAMRPLMQFVGRRKQQLPFKRDVIRGWVGRASQALGTHPFYLDVMRLDPLAPVAMTDGNVAVLEVLYAYARKLSLQFIPILPVGDSSPKQRRLVEDAALHDGRGMAFRFAVRTLAAAPGKGLIDHVAEELAATECDASQVDLLIDLDYIDADVELDLATLLEEAVRLAKWRSFAVLGTCVPAMMSCIEEGSVGTIARREWQLWSDLRARLSRAPTFGDYAIQHPRPPANGGPGMRASIRYTASDELVVARGEGLVIQQGSAQYRLLCQQLIARDEFRGSTYSWGDGVIYECASGALPPGSQRMWRAAGTSHHIEFVTKQLQQP